MAKRKNTEQVQINVRMREGLRAKLEQAAKRNYESLNREINDRLERSFDRQSLLPEALTLAYGEKVAGEIMIIAKAFNDAGRVAHLGSGQELRAQPWHRSPFAYEQAAIAAVFVLNAMRPPGEVVPPRPSLAETFPDLEKTGLHTAQLLLSAIKRKAPPDLRAWVSTVRNLLDLPEETS